MTSVFRVLGVDLNPKKNVVVALRKCFGIGEWKSQEVCAKLGMHPRAKLNTLQYMMPTVAKYCSDNFETKAQANRRIGNDIGLKIKIHSYEGQRHQYALPLNGQKNINGKTQRRLGVLRARQLNFPLAKPSKKTGRK